MERETHDYDDIIHLPRHVSVTHRPMPLSDRAAQFAPFAALTGFDALVRERTGEEGQQLADGTRLTASSYTDKRRRI